MKLTPLDIHHKEFRHALRGYNEEEVDQFLDQVADEFERLFKENIDLSERIEALQNKVNEFEMQRQTINNTLMTAQRSADDITARAQGEADGIIAHANTRAKEIVNDALAKKQQVRGELLRIKAAEEEFRERYRSMLESNLRSIAAVPSTDDVSALLGEADEPVDSPLESSAYASSAPASAPAPTPWSEPVVSAAEPEAFEDFSTAGEGQQPFVIPEPMPVLTDDDFGLPELDVVPEPTPAPAVAPAPAPVPESIPVAESVPFAPISIDDLPAPSDFDDMATPVSNLTQPMPAAGFEGSGLISAVSLGELESPEIPDDLDLVEPSEFSLPRFDALGEREDDLDIEEID